MVARLSLPGGSGQGSGLWQVSTDTAITALARFAFVRSHFLRAVGTGLTAG
jgi:hypothetical protein